MFGLRQNRWTFPTADLHRFYITDVKQPNQTSTLMTEDTLKTVSIVQRWSHDQKVFRETSNEQSSIVSQIQDLPFDEIMDPIYS